VAWNKASQPALPSNVICGTPDLKLPEQTALELPQRAERGEPYRHMIAFPVQLLVLTFRVERNSPAAYSPDP